MRIDAVGQTDVGQKRDHNEDYYLLDEDLGLYVVCDGMGGHAAGEVASDHAANTVKRVVGEHATILEAFEKEDTPETRDQLSGLVESAIQTACNEIYNMATADSGKAGMGTTLVMMLVVNGKGVMGHVGDSRLYMVRGGQIHQLSEDHSYCTEMIKRGKMTREQARTSPYANVITRAVGIQESVQVDTLLFDILPGDTFLLCSDGLHGYTEDPNELAELLEEKDLNKLPKQLIDVANERGGKDNITALLIRGVAEDGDQEQEESRANEVNLKLETLKKIPLFRYLTYQELVKVLNITYLETLRRLARPSSKRTRPAAKSSTSSSPARSSVSARRPATSSTCTPACTSARWPSSTSRPRSATITAREPARLLVVQRRSFYTLIRKEPVLAVKLLWSVCPGASAAGLRETNEQLSESRARKLERPRAARRPLRRRRATSTEPLGERPCAHLNRHRPIGR
jgi:serine/threonine protein phosphatase PrpC